MTTVSASGLLVDLDDTVINFGGSTASSWKSVSMWAASEAPGVQADALLATIHRIREWYWSNPERHREGRADLHAASQRIVAQAFAELGHERPELAHAVASRYRDLRDESIHVIPGAIAALERLRARGLRLCLVTNGTSRDQRGKIARFDLARHFDHILIEGEFGCGKPDERVYIAAMEALGARPEDTWFVGDNLEWDVAAPQRLGVSAIWVDTELKGLPTDAPARPKHIIRSFAELT